MHRELAALSAVREQVAAFAVAHAGSAPAALGDEAKRTAARIAVAEVQKHHAVWAMAQLRVEVHRAPTGLPPGADGVITVSEYSRTQIEQVLGIPRRCIAVTPEAADSRFVPTSIAGEGPVLRGKLDLPDRFMLYIGGAEGRKNIATLIRAWAQAAARRPSAA